MITDTTCDDCEKQNHKIISHSDRLEPKPPLHPHCRCYLAPLPAVVLGTVTAAGPDGADVYVASTGMLPDRYITSQQAEQAGWNRFDGNLSDVLPEKLIGGDIFKNRSGILPEAAGRIWYEADLTIPTAIAIPVGWSILTMD